MTRQRDLTGFGAKPAPPRVPRPIAAPSMEPSLVPPPPRSQAAGNNHDPASPPRRKAAAKQRITLSLPTQVATMLRSTAEAEQRIYLDIILVAFVAHAAEVERDLINHRIGPNPTGGRRRAGAGRTQIPLNILKEDLRVLDRHVKSLNLDRSAYVTELLLRELRS